MGSGKPHAGQLRFHDFALLRQARLINLPPPRFAGAACPSLPPPSNGAIPAVTGGSIGQRRGLFTAATNKLMSDFHLKILERNANANPTNVDVQYQFLRELNHRYPDAVVARFEQFPQQAVDERCALEYLGALGRLDVQSNGRMTMSRFDLGKLVHRLVTSGGGHVSPMTIQALNNLAQQGQGGGAAVVGEDGKSKKARAPTRAQQAMAATEILSGGGIAPLGALSAAAAGNAAGGGHSAAGAAAPRFLSAGGAGGMGGGSGYGADPKRPLHVVIDSANAGFRAQLFKLARSGLYVFFLLSLLGAIMDEKGGLSRAIGGGGKVVQEAEGSSVRFDDVKGIDEAKDDLLEIVEYLRNPEKFTRLGGKLPRGLLLTGPPGTGKTMLAKAIAGEADVPFFFSSGSQFEEMYVGVGAKRVRDLFEAAKEKAPCIVFIDEIDAVGGSRKLKDQSALKMTLNELLVQMDGFEENNGIIVIGATNFKESLDTALLRPGRFDKHVTVPMPDVAGRKDILEMYARRTKLAKDVDLNVLARGTPGFSGADLFNLMNQAALKASVDGLNAITMSVLEFAKDKILMGAERKSAVITAKTARCTAFHEAGHALVAILTEGAQPVHKATIMPRGSSLGMVSMLPEGDQTSQSLKEMLAFMDVAMGGRVAEELVFGEENVTSGAMSDIANATRIARAMVTKYGFSDDVGVVFFGGESGEENASAETRAKIDSEVKKLTDKAYARATELLKKHRKEHQLLAETLLEYETLTGDEVRELVLKGIKPRRPVINDRGGAKGDTSIFTDDKNSPKKSPIPGVGGKVGARRERSDA